MGQLAETIYAQMVTKLYTDLSKADEEDLRKMAQNALRAEKIYHESLPYGPDPNAVDAMLKQECEPSRQ